MEDPDSTAIAAPKPLYTRLDTSRCEVLLLRVYESEGWLDTIVCSLETVSLGDEQEYIALSYEWGGYDPDEDKNKATVNGTQIRSTINLLGALRYLRETRQGNRFWVDALCINQNDLAERAQQVQIMSRIYQKALLVAMWIGKRQDDSDLAIGLIEKSVSLVRRPDPELGHAEVVGLLDNPEYQSHLEAFRHLCTRSYWKGLWIVQVIAFGDVDFILCGERCAPFYGLAGLLSHIVGRGMTLNKDIDMSETVQALTLSPIQEISNHHKDRQQRHQKRSLLQLISSFNRNLCSNPRDRVYSLLNLAHPYKGVKPAIDYSISCREVYMRTACYIIQGSDALDIHHYCGRTDEALDSDLRSWVPDWPCYMPWMSLWNWEGSHDKEIPSGSFIIAESCLRVTILNLGTVKVISDTETWTKAKGFNSQRLSWLRITIHFFTARVSTVQRRANIDAEKRRFSGFCGPNTRVGDQVVKVQGCRDIFILRHNAERGQYRLAVPAYSLDYEDVTNNLDEEQVWLD